jgi:hypothetical protein
MVSEIAQERLKNLHIEPIFEVGNSLRKIVRQRSENLSGIIIEKPTPLPPLEWMVLGVAIVCLMLVFRERRHA